MIRTYEQAEVETLAQYADIPVINGLTDYSHPCQVLADLLTIREKKGTLNGLKLCYIGDGNNMANSLTVGCLTVDVYKRQSHGFTAIECVGRYPAPGGIFPGRKAPSGWLREMCIRDRSNPIQERIRFPRQP